METKNQVAKKPTECPYCMGFNIERIPGRDMWRCVTNDTCLKEFWWVADKK